MGGHKYSASTQQEPEYEALKGFSDSLQPWRTTGRTEIWESREDTTGRCDQSSGTFRGDQRGVLLGQMGIVKNHVLL